MKSILKKDRILVFVALLGLLASLAPLAARTKAEQSNRYYDYILDYSSLRYMASQSTQSEGEWLDRFASLGIDKATVAEATALGLSGSAGIPIHAMTVKDAMGDFGWESNYPDEVVSSMHVHLDHRSCLEVIAVKGRACKVNELANCLLGIKGILYGKLTVAATEDRLEA